LAETKTKVPAYRISDRGAYAAQQGSSHRHVLH
jgi:hypothetical protein